MADSFIEGGWAVTTVFVMQTVSMYVAQKLRAKKQKTSHRESKGGREAHPCFPIENPEACELAPEESVPIIGQPVPPLGELLQGYGPVKAFTEQFSLSRISKKPEKIERDALTLDAPREYHLPPLDLLARPEPHAAAISARTPGETATALNTVLKDFGIRGEIIQVNPVPWSRYTNSSPPQVLSPLGLSA